MGQYWLVKSTTVHIQGLYRPTHATSGLSVMKAIAFGGPFMRGNKIIIETQNAYFIPAGGAQQAIITGFPANFDQGDLHVRYDSMGATMQKGRAGMAMHVVHLQLPLGVSVQVNRWMEASEGNYINAKVHMSAQPGMDGHCGNFNGNQADDDRLEIRKRLGYNGIPQGELIGFHHKTPIDNTFEGHPTISHCASNILTAAHTKCQQEEGHYIPSMNCLVNKCQNGVVA